MNMEKQLPNKPSLEHLKAQAKDLLKELRVGDPSAKLSRAQWTLAQQYGFASWPKLVERVREIELAHLQYEHVVKIVEHGIRGGQFERDCRRVLSLHPAMARASNACSLVALDAEMVESSVSAGNVNDPTGDLNIPPIVYIAFSPFARDDLGKWTLLLQKMLDLGADPSANWIHPSYPDSPLSVLYAASGMVRSPEATEMLLRAGANPNDNESLYHSTETRDHACLKLLLNYGATTKGTNALMHALDYEDPEAIDLLLEAGADVEEVGALAHAIRQGRSDTILGKLLAAGADPNRSFHGGSAAQLAFIRGRNLPVSYKPSREDELLAACWRGDVAKATELRSVFSTLLFGRRAFTDACWAGNAKGVEAFLATGFTIVDRDNSKGTPLHIACFIGNLELVNALLPHNPPLDDRNDMHEANPLQWAAYASEFATGNFPGANYPDVVERMIAAGSPAPTHLLGSDEVRAILLDRWEDLVEFRE